METLTFTEGSEVDITEIQREAAERAANVGQFQSEFRAIAAEVLKDATYEERAAVEAHQRDVVDIAVDGIKDLGVEEMPEGQLGEAEIGGHGRVSASMLAEMDTAHDAELANHAGEHERGHMDSVHLSGDLIVDGHREDTRALYEAFAELAGNRGIGQGTGYFRDGQPEDYRHAQEVGILLEQEVGRPTFEETMTGDGDVRRLQIALDKKGRGRTEEQLPLAA